MRIQCETVIKYISFLIYSKMNRRILRVPALIRCQINQERSCSNTSQLSTEEEKQKELERIARDASIDSPPTGCCQSGCANCVFIVWAEALSAKMQNATPDICEKILKMVDDPSMKAYLELELRIRGLKK